MRRFFKWMGCGIPATAFLVAAYGKIKDPVGFFESIRLYQMIHGQLIFWAVWFLISLELVCGVALLLPPLRKGAILVLAPLLLLFSIAGLSAKLRGLDISCGCFGTLDSGSPFGWAAMGRNVALIGCLAGAWILDRPEK